MSSIERVENLKQLIRMAEPDFNQLARIHGAVNFARESSFALQALQNNSYLAQVAMGDQDSFKRAIINVAAIGLSLSPVFKLAYLVPRGKKVCLDISYRGFVQLATDIGAIKWAMAEVVCAQDTFEQGGFGQAPTHKFNPFSDRGEPVGAYCVAKTHDGEFLTTIMSAEEIISIRDRSESFKSGSGPWFTDRNEMIKKTVIRRAYKLWPMTDSRQRFDQAVDVSSDADPIDMNAAPSLPSASQMDARSVGLAEIRQLLGVLGRTEEKYIEHLTRSSRREIKKLDDLTDLEMSQAIIFLKSFAEAQMKKESAVENAG